MIELVGDLGSGKTTFVRGLVDGLGGAGVVSPTFTMSREYECANGLQVHHYDLYRLEGRDVVSEELLESINSPKVVTVTEWANTQNANLPIQRIKITMHHSSNDQTREVRMSSEDSDKSKMLAEVANVFSN